MDVLTFSLRVIIMIDVKQCTTLQILTLTSLAALVVHEVTSATYFVIPDDHSPHHTDANTFSLQHYLNNTSKYFVSHNQFHFMQGQYYINNDFIIKDIDNFTITGPAIGQCNIICTSPASVVVINVKSIQFQNISVINCVKNHKSYFDTPYFATYYARNYGPFSKATDYSTSLFLWNSSSVIIYNININATVNTSFSAILIVNVRDGSLVNVKVQVNPLHCANFNKHPTEINGLKVFICFYDKISNSGSLIIDNFHYRNYKTCHQGHHLLCVIVIMLLRNDRYDVKNRFMLIILNSVFSNLMNSSILCSYGETMEGSKTQQISIRFITIRNCTFSENSGHGNPNLNMFNIELKHFEQYQGPPSQILSLTQLYKYFIRFDKCTFKRNANIKSLIYVRPSNAQMTTGYIPIINSTFSDNKNVTFIKVELEFQTTCYMIIYISLTSVNVSSNEYHYTDSLILIVNGVLYFRSVFFNQNHHYDSIVHLQSSKLYIKNHNEISNNCVRHIIIAQSNSLLFMHYHATFNISYNAVYKVMKLVSTFEKHAIPICPLQVYGNIDNFHLDTINCTLLLSNNIEMISKTLPTEIISYVNNKCDWLEGTIFQKINTNVLTAYHKILKSNNSFVHEAKKRLVPLCVCPCLSNSSYNCYMANVYTVYPGQLLHINLIISPRWSELSSTIIAANTKDDDCSILDSYQLSQTHTNNGCNRYSYTIWPNSEFITECKLFIGLSKIPEMFYVQMKPCPMGFTLQSGKKGCYCDPLLRNDKVSITLCDINDGTILRPANSWISAVTVNNSHSYNVSSQCPFDYCSPYSSHLNLSNPDSQCQFKRSGVVCAECQQGLSTVFGSSHCKQCSNLYLLLIIPITVAGVVLVMLLFIFNLTVTNGIINTLIFYVNIISINYSLFCIESNSPDCTILSLLNLDLGIETCFYDGMDGYTKMWLQLVFPSYLMIIAFTMIIGSRYSSKLQRLTATRVLKVLATLFLLSYTKTLLTVCQVLFFFSSITRLPSEHTTLFWSVDTGVELFRVKFCILYIVCLIVFITLLLFNALLLFPRTVSRWKFVNYFKPLLDAYFGPYKLKYPFWTGLQLLIRSCFFGLSALSRSVSLFGGAVLVGILLCTHGLVHPFKSRFINFQESLVLLNILAVYVTALYNEYENSKYKLFIIRLLIITVLAYFIVLIFCHCIMLMYGDVIKERANKVKQMLMKNNIRKRTHSESLQLEQLRSKIPDVAFNYKEFREPLIVMD